MRTRRLKSSGGPVLLNKEHPLKAADTQQSAHKPVLLHEVIENLAIRPDDVVVDATVGAGLHAAAILQKLGAKGTFVGVDTDLTAIARFEEALKNLHTAKIHLVTENFRNLGKVLHKLGIPKISKALFDLGWSAYQLSAGRGFSFSADEPLLMTYEANPTEGALTAQRIVNGWAEESISSILFGWGQERYSRIIARKIVERRNKKPFRTSRELAETIREAVPAKYRWGRIHPATRTFQALRMAVNDELGALKEGLAAAWSHLAPHGRIAVISFHSIEDREVKRIFVEWEKYGDGKRVSKKPIRPDEKEISENPRSRSSKLRVIEKS